MAQIENKKTQIYYLPEAGYRKNMKKVVEPYLRKYRCCGSFTSFDGTQIFFVTYIQKEAKGSIVISHGFSEFAEKYNEMVFYFLQAGYCVFLPEHRGHGRSERKMQNLDKVYVKNFAEYVRDLHIFVKKFVMPCRNEMYLFAHSMGGGIGAVYLQRYPYDFKKAVLSSPMIQMKIGGVPYPAAIVIAHLFRLCGLGRMYAAGQEGFHREPDFEHSCCLSEERYLYAHGKRKKDRRSQTCGATYGWVSAAGLASAYMQHERSIRRIKIPVLVFAAGREHMVNTDEICRFAGKLPKARLVWFVNAKHEIFNAGERAMRQFYDEVFAFLSE